jgi:hypothetical protein
MTQEQVEQLLQLQKLYESGILSADEFASEKAKVLSGNVPNKTNKSKNNRLFTIIKQGKFKIPLLILSGMCFGFICLFLIPKVISFSNDVVEMDSVSTIEEVENDIFEDKFERLWVIGTTRDYTDDDLKEWNIADLKVLRNYFFAKNNYIFGSKELNDYFSKYSWYNGLYKEANDVMFTDLQINNVQFIKKLEGLPNSYKSPR